MRFPAIGILGSCLAFLPACEATNLYIAHNTVIGVNGAMNADSRSGHVIVGYDRKFAAIVPKSAPPLPEAADIPDAHEAMSVLSCSEMQVDGIFLTGFTEYLATGIAAKRFANQVKVDLKAEREKRLKKGGGAAAAAATGAVPAGTSPAAGVENVVQPSGASGTQSIGSIFDCYLDKSL